MGRGYAITSLTSLAVKGKILHSCCHITVRASFKAEKTNLQCLKKVLKCRFTDGRTDLLRINCVYLTLTLSSSGAAASRDKRHKGALCNWNHAELSLRVLALSHKPGCEGVGGQGLGAGSGQGGSREEGLKQ